jgi:hypothetical protein
MNIMLCGASDIEAYLEPFKEVVYLFEGIPHCFIDGTIRTNNFKDWTDNSEESVKKSDVILFLIHKNYGSITWGTEYRIAKQTGKPYLILCLDETYNSFLRIDGSINSHTSEESKDFKIMELIQNLMIEKKTIISFSETDFKVVFKKQLSQKFLEGAELLQKENLKTTLLNFVMLKDKFKEELLIKENEAYLKSMLMDIFQPKEVRKKILECYFNDETFKLELDELQDLIYDTEQGIRRRTVQLLPGLFHSGLHQHKESFFDFLIKRSDDEDDSGFDRRLIISLLDLDAVLAVNKLRSFKMTDIGVPKRIMNWVVEHIEELNKNLSNEKFVNDLKELTKNCKEYEKGPNSLKNTVTKVEDWLNGFQLN